MRDADEKIRRLVDLPQASIFNPSTPRPFAAQPHVYPMKKIVGGVAALLLAGAIHPAFGVSINFDAQGLTGPSTFGNPAQTVAITADDLGNPLGGSVTFTGGVILEQTTFLPADRTALYGTANYSDLTNPLTITFALGGPIHNFFLDVLNGLTVPADFLLADDAGHSATFSLPANMSSGMTTIGFAAAGNVVTVTQLGVTGGPTSNWDYFVDNIHFNESLPSTPEPAATGLLLAGALAIHGIPGRRIRRTRS